MKFFKRIILFVLISNTLLGCNEVNKTEKGIESESNSKIREVNEDTDSLRLNSKVNESENWLGYIDFLNEIEISHTDDRYGEWGGDSDIIIIYSKGNDVFANYSRYLGSSEPPMPPKENEKSKKWYEYKELEKKIDSIKLNDEEKQLVESSVTELLKHKMSNENMLAHSGIYNRVVSKDSSLIISDYPSFEWKSFQTLKNKLIKK